jgi:hypothetical protein
MLTIDLDFFESLRDLPPKERMLKAALWYAKQGIKVIPSPKGTKHLGVPELQATTDAATIKKWYGKDFAEGNITLEIQEHNISVIDFDRHGEIDGFKNAGIVEANLSGLTVTTPHNGIHLYILGNTAFKRLPKGIEHKTTRVVVPPSVVDGVAYEWRTGGSPQELSPDLATKLVPLKIVSSNAKPQTRAEVFAQNYESTPIAPLGYVKRLLEYMDPGADYLEWSKVGMAMHHNDDSDVSLNAWRDWSMDSVKYKVGECEKKWETFSQFKDNVVTLRWLILTAKGNGCPDSSEDDIYYGANYALDKLVETMNLTYNYRLMSSTFRICWLHKNVDGDVEFRQYKEPDFRSMLQNQFVLHGTQWYSIAEAWLKNPRRRSGEVNMWELGKEPPNAMNLYQGLAIEPVQCDKIEIPFFLDFTLNIICRGNTEYNRYLLDLLAYKVQHPLRLPGVCLVLQGGEGTGKGSLCGIMEAIFGKFHAMAVSNRRALVGEYNGMIIANALWVTANEAFWAGSAGEAERLKAMITERTLDWNEKFVPIWSQRNCIFLTITTNNKWAVPADVDSRRFFVLRVSDERAKDVEYWNAFHLLLGKDEDTGRAVNPEYVGKVLYYLQQRKITSSFVNALETTWLIEQRGQTILGSDDDGFVSWVTLFLQETSGDIYLGKGGTLNFAILKRLGKACVLSTPFYDDYRDFVTRHFRKQKVYTREAFNKALSQLGFIMQRVKKESLMVGQSKFGGEPESKVMIAYIPSNAELEAALREHYKLLTDDVEDAED